jgi:hypothetical protein
MASLAELKIPFPNGVFFPGKSVNDIFTLHLGITSLVSNAVTTRSAFKKRKIIEIDDDVEDVNSPSGTETFHPNTQPIRERESQDAKPSSSLLSTTSHQPVKPLYCSPNQIWHLRFGHASTTTLHELLYIKSSHDSTRCVICIRSNQTRKLFLPSTSEVSRKLERIHSDICEPFLTSKGLLLLNFLDEYSHWCWIALIDDKSSATVNREFRRLLKQIETLKIKFLRTNGSLFASSNEKAVNRNRKTFARAMLYQANMPKSFWVEAMSTAAYLINRLPSEAINDVNSKRKMASKAISHLGSTSSETLWLYCSRRTSESE